MPDPAPQQPGLTDAQLSEGPSETTGPRLDHCAEQRRLRTRETIEDVAIVVEGQETVIRLHRYRSVPGSGSARSRPRMLLIHGFRGDHHGMLRLASHLEEMDLVVPDLPGFGASSPLSVRHTMSAYAAVVEAIAAAEGFGDQDLLMGHSFGSLVVAHHAATRRLQWGAVLLICPISEEMFTRHEMLTRHTPEEQRTGSPGNLQLTGAALHPPRISRLLPGALLTEAYYRLCERAPEPLGLALLRSRLALAVTNLTMITSKQPEMRAYVREQHRRYFGGFADRRTVLEAYYASSRHSVTEVAGQIDAPVLLITGTRDPLSTPRGLADLQSALRHSQTQTLRGVGHLIHYEAPAAAARAIRRFLHQRPH